MSSSETEHISLTALNMQEGWLPEVVRDKLGAIFKREVREDSLRMDLDAFRDPIRDQYHSTEILKYFIANESISDRKICYLVEVDLFIPILTFVFGEAHMHGSHCIVSGHRLDEQYYGRPENQGLYADRLCKEIVHELGHTFGLTHCIDTWCVMSNSYLIEDTDAKNHYPCDRCFEDLDKVL